MDEPAQLGATWHGGARYRGTGQGLPTFDFCRSGVELPAIGRLGVFQTPRRAETVCGSCNGNPTLRPRFNIYGPTGTRVFGFELFAPLQGGACSSYGVDGPCATALITSEEHGPRSGDPPK